MVADKMDLGLTQSILRDAFALANSARNEHTNSNDQWWNGRQQDGQVLVPSLLAENL
jgi:hypothetical protein